MKSVGVVHAIFNQIEISQEGCTRIATVTDMTWDSQTGHSVLQICIDSLIHLNIYIYIYNNDDDGDDVFFFLCGATNSYRCPNLSWLLTTPSVCIKVVLEHTVNSITLQKVLCCYKNGEKKAINNGKETDIHNSCEKSRSFLQRNCKGSQDVSMYIFLHHKKAPRNWEILWQQSQKTGSWKSTACSIGGSQVNSSKHILIVVVVSKSQFQQWREDFELQVWQVELQQESKTSE